MMDSAKILVSTLDFSVRTIESKLLDIARQPYNADERRLIFDATRGGGAGSKRVSWLNYRKGLISGTRAHAVHTGMRSVKNGRNFSPRSLLDGIIGHKEFHGSEVTRWGTANKNKALDSYKKIMASTHRDTELELDLGLVYHQQVRFIAGTPDATFVCSCCGNRVVEIKCPFRAKDKKISDLISDHALELLDEAGQLKRSHSYYTQVQVYMALTGTDICDFVLWSPLDKETPNIQRVNFDRDYWRDVEASDDYFFEHYLLSTIVHKSLEAGPTPPGTSGAHGKAALVHDVATTPFGTENMCQKCTGILPDSDRIINDINQASVRCDCPCACEKWFHQKCCDYDQELLNLEDGEDAPPWYCAHCRVNCDCDSIP